MRTNIDLEIDWITFYESRVKGLKKAGTNKLLGLCPFHQDTTPSFWFNTNNGCFKCEACGASGNGTTFLARIEGIDNKAAYKTLLALAGKGAQVQQKKGQLKDQNQQQPGEEVQEKEKQQGQQVQQGQQGQQWQQQKEQKEQQKFTLEAYANMKKLPMEFLASLQLKNTNSGITIPYFDEAGNLLCSRNRNGIRGFSWAKGSKVSLYGLWKLKEFSHLNYIVLVEGESDAQTLWLHNLPALGVPGASTFQQEWTRYLKGKKVYIYKEPDQGGETFLRRITDALRRVGFQQQVYVMTLDGFKDPSDLFLTRGENFEDSFCAAMDQASRIDVEREGMCLTDAPVSLRIPLGYKISEDGIFQMDEKSGICNRVCSTPILIANRISSLESNEKKLEIIYRKDGKWHNQIVQRSILFQSKTIIQLSDLGINVTSENARQLVLYLGSLIDDNLDLIEVVASVTQMGWHDKGFLPYLADHLVLDVDANSRRWASAYKKKGTLQAWINNISSSRDNHIFRFLLACSFAAPLLMKMKHRIFLVHNWGDSRFGKTAALKAALSVWGDPEGLMANFNSTKVGLERMASFFTDLPLGIDEKQVAGTKQEFVETLVYMLSLGKSRVRGTKTGGVQNWSSWRSIILMTGEEPIIASTSQGGVQTRVMELYGTPFENEEAAARMHRVVSEDYGFAGAVFLKAFMDMPCHFDELRELYNLFCSQFAESNKVGLHVNNVALVAATDVMVSKILFQQQQEKAMEAALEMGKSLLGELIDQQTDVIDTAYDYIREWVISNKLQFDRDAKPIYGFFEGHTIYILPSVLEEALTKKGFSYRKTIKALGERERIGVSWANGKKRYSVVKRFNGTVSRFIEIRFSDKEESAPF